MKRLGPTTRRPVRAGVVAEDQDTGGVRLLGTDHDLDTRRPEAEVHESDQVARLLHRVHRRRKGSSDRPRQRHGRGDTTGEK